LTALDRAKRPVAVAIGRDAVDAARRRRPEVPIVFCQVFNYEDLLSARQRIWGVAPMPPLPLQLKAWKSVDPTLKRVGMIMSRAHADMANEAAAAARSDGIRIDSETSSSDQETLYLFKRLAARVDGFWLFPDNRILSPNVLRELLSYARSHEVGVLVSSDILLSWGALLSASSTPKDVARGVSDVLDRVATGRTAGLPAMTPLTEVRLTINPIVAADLGAARVPASPWVLHEPH
jgi:ABC-type uncharacterized transport system substrate-binding protein